MKRSSLSKNIRTLILGILCSVCSFGYAQNSVVSGVIKTESGDVIPFSTVKNQNTGNGVIADIDGAYSISATAGDILIISSIGYYPQEITVGNQATIDVVLKEDIESLENVVVVGYGTQKKENLTGAVSVVESTQLEKKQITTVAEGLQGLTSGLRVRGGGQPGADAIIEIRGLSNLGNNSPLYVIDGFVTTANRDFNPNDIESIQILKDASAAAIYGSRAANGVIIITTKKGKEGPMKVNASAKTGFSEIPRYDLMNTDEFAVLNRQAYQNAGLTPQNLNTDINTDWQDEIFKRGLLQDYNVSFSGGSGNSSYFVSGNYFGNEGTIYSTDFDRLSLRVNSSGTKGIFSIGENVALSNAKADEMSGAPILDAYRLLPTIPVYDDRNPGGYGYGEDGVANTFGTNPIALADLFDTQNQNFRIRGNVWSELNPFKFLKYRFNLGYETSFDNQNRLRKVGNWTLNQPYDPSFLYENRARSYTMLVENILTAEKTFGDHDFKLIGGTTYEEGDYRMIWGNKRNITTNPSDGSYFTQLDVGDTPETGGFATQANLISYLGRMEYNYADKYLINAVFRRDGSSRFSDNNKWRTFPSASVAWRISNEDFFTIDKISSLKLRASYGELGNTNAGNYEYQGFINAFPAAVFGNNQTVTPAATQVRLSNNELKWEILKQTNIGFDLGMFDEALQLSVNYYKSDTEDLLAGLPILISTGNDGGNPRANAASMRSSGFELDLSHKHQFQTKFFLQNSFNVTTHNNELLALGNREDELKLGSTILRKGEPLGMFYLLKTDGIFQSVEEVNNYKSSNGTVIMPYAQPGDIRFVDTNDDGFISDEDKQIAGNPWPKFDLGYNLNGEYGSFDFSMNWIGSFGSTVYNGFRSVVDRFDDDSNYRAGIQPWTPENPNTDFPRIVRASTLNSRGDTDRWLEKGDFVRLKYVDIGYKISPELLNKIGFTNTRLSVSGQNLLTFTKYGGLDPEFINYNIFEKGVDWGGAFPNLQSVNLGVNLNF